MSQKLSNKDKYIIPVILLWMLVFTATAWFGGLYTGREQQRETENKEFVEYRMMYDYLNDQYEELQRICKEAVK